jgi:hypothetical protein
MISWWMLLGMTSVLDKICRGNRNIHFMFNNIVFFGNLSFNEIMWGKYSTAREDREDNIMYRRQDAISMPDN